MATRKQRAAARRNIKKAQAALRTDIRRGERRPTRERRRYMARRERRRGEKRRASLLKLIGFGLGAYESATIYTGGPGYPQNLLTDPAGAVTGLLTGITGYNPQYKNWSIDNMVLFWGPVVGFWALDWVGKKLLHKSIKITKDISLF